MGLNIKPLADRVLVEPTEAETTTASEIGRASCRERV